MEAELGPPEQVVGAPVDLTRPAAAKRRGRLILAFDELMRRLQRDFLQ